MQFKIFSWLVLILCALELAAQRQEVHLTTYGFENGLAHRNTWYVFQDAEGLLWISTEKGLCRYDGHNFITWQKAYGDSLLPLEPILQATPDYTRNKWLLLQRNHLTLFRPGLGMFNPVRPDTAAAVEWQYLSATIDPDGGVWACARKPGSDTTFLLKTNLDGWLEPVTDLPLELQRPAMAFLADTLYVAAGRNLLWRFDDTGRLTGSFELPAPASDPSYSTILAMMSVDGRLWLLLDNAQVGFIDPATGYFVRHPSSNLLPENLELSTIYPEEGGGLWIGGVVNRSAAVGEPCSYIQSGPVLLYFNPLLERLTDYSFYLKQSIQFSSAPRQLFVDNTGTLWIPTEFGLVHLVHSRLFEHYLSGGNDCCIDGVCSMRGMAEDDEGNIYFSYYNGLHMLRKATNTLEPITGPNLPSLNSPFGLLWHNGYLWMGNGLRLRLSDSKAERFSDKSCPEGVLLLDEEGDIWYGCQNHLLIFRNGNPALSYEWKGLSQNRSETAQMNATFLFQSADGTIWVGTQSHGLFGIGKRGGLRHHIHLQSEPALPDNRILGICESGGRLWVGTANGLAALDLANKSVHTFRTEDGLSNNFINAVLPEGDSAVWASTDNGLCRVDALNSQVLCFYDSDGLSRNEFNRISALRASDGRLYFGGLDGVNAFYPGSAITRQFAPQKRRIVLCEISWFDGSTHHLQRCNFDMQNGIELTWRDRIFTAWFTITDYTDPTMHLFRYKLEGFDKAWSEPSPLNFARYFNLPAGEYVLRVKASPLGSKWIAEELALPLFIKEAFYKSTWFQLGLALFIVLLVYLIMEYRLMQAYKKELELERLVDERTTELEAEKQKSESLLLNILPRQTAEELKATGMARARLHENVTVLFADFKDFSKISNQLSPEELVKEIDFCFRGFDEIVDRHQLEKIKTVGDAYLCAGGLRLGDLPPPDPREKACQTILAAMDMLAFLQERARHRKAQGLPWFEARIGIHIGPVVAGVVGSRKFAFDIWGDTVNVAQRLEATCLPGHINISREVYEMVKDHFQCKARGKIAVKNIGPVEMHFVESKLG